MKVFIGADHRGYNQKRKVIKLLEGLGHEVKDLGAYSADNCSDYPKFGCKVSKAVAKTKDSRGILICMTGIGQSIVANKVRGAYAALCYNPAAAKYSREHNNSNVLVLSSKYVKNSDVDKIIKIWLKTDFAGGRHLRRFNQIKKVESGKRL